MKKKLFLVTDGFPYGKGEKPFIIPELPYLQEHFDVTIISCVDEIIKKDASSITELDNNIKLLTLVPKKCLKDKFVMALSAMVSMDMWREWLLIIKEKKKIIKRLYYALIQYVTAELFYRQLIQSVDLEDVLIYTYWNNIRTLGVCRHKKKYKNLKIITRVHGYDLYNERGLAGRQYFRWVVNRHLDGLYFVSQKGLNYYRDTFGVKDSSKLFYAPLGIGDMPMSPSAKAEDEFLLVSCSNVIPLKRVDLIIRALACVKSKRKIHWVHFGDGSEISRVRALAKELLTCKDAITYEFKGHIDNHKIRTYYTTHAVGSFITVSSTEGVPVSIQEALCAAVPIIGTNVGGIPEMINNNGILLSSDPTPFEVASAIMRLVELSNESYNVFKECSRKIWWEKYNASKNYQSFVDRLIYIS